MLIAGGRFIECVQYVYGSVGCVGAHSLLHPPHAEQSHNHRRIKRKPRCNYHHNAIPHDRRAPICAAAFRANVSRLIFLGPPAFKMSSTFAVRFSQLPYPPSSTDTTRPLQHILATWQRRVVSHSKSAGVRSSPCCRIPGAPFGRPSLPTSCLPPSKPAERMMRSGQCARRAGRRRSSTFRLNAMRPVAAFSLPPPPPPPIHLSPE